MNARERQIKELMERPDCPVCGRPSPIGTHDCDEPYTVRDARARIDAQDLGSISGAILDYVAASGDEVGSIRMNRRTRRAIHAALRAGPQPIDINTASREPVAEIQGIKVFEEERLPDDVLAFVGGRTRDEIIRSILDGVTVNDSGLNAVSTAMSGTGAAALTASDALRGYAAALQAGGLSKAHGMITGITS